MKLPNIFETKLIHTQIFRDAALPPPNTPDLCVLQKAEYWNVFDWNNIIRTHCRFKEAYTSRKYFMYRCAHEYGTPLLLFQRQMHPDYPTVPARLRGKIHLVSPRELVEIDKQQCNRVHCVRKLVRIILPAFFQNERPRNHSHIEPVVCMAWIYIDNEAKWEEAFSLDRTLYRVKASRGYQTLLLRNTWLDNRSYVGRYYVPKFTEPRIPPNWIGMNAGRRELLQRIKDEENIWERYISDSAKIKLEDNETTSTLPQLS